MWSTNQLVKATVMRLQPIRHNKVERKVLSFTFGMGGSDSDKFAFKLSRLVSSDICSSLTQCTNGRLFSRAEILYGFLNLLSTYRIEAKVPVVRFPLLSGDI